MSVTHIDGFAVDKSYSVEIFMLLFYSMIVLNGGFIVLLRPVYALKVVIAVHRLHLGDFF